MLVSRKRPHSPDVNDEHSCSRNRCYRTFVLDSESTQPTDEDSESCYSVQLANTVSAKDTSDSSWSSESVAMDVEMEEYDVASITHSDEKLMSNCDSSGTDDMICSATVTTLLVASNLAEDEDMWADTSDMDSDTEIDTEIPLDDYWDCVRCKSKCSPLNPYCLKCFQLRKGYFPERPKRQHPRRRRRRKVSQPGNAPAESTADVAETERVLTPCSEPEDELGSLEKVDSGINVASVGTQSSTEFVDSSVPILQNLPLDSQDCKKQSSRELIDSGVPPSKKEKLLKESQDTVTTDDYVRRELCFMCVERPRNGGFVHKTSVHILCCYQCSLKSWNKTRKCPLCSRRPQNVVKLIYG